MAPDYMALNFPVSNIIHYTPHDINYAQRSRMGSLSKRGFVSGAMKVILGHY